MSFRVPLSLTFAVLLSIVPRLPAEDAVAALMKIGARVTIDDAKPGKPVVAVTITNPTITDDALAPLKELPHLEVLELRFTQIGDKATAYLKDLTSLKVLNLSGTKVGDAGLAQ